MDDIPDEKTAEPLMALAATVILDQLPSDASALLEQYSRYPNDKSRLNKVQGGYFLY
jgi:hypothetical protein